MRSFEGDLRVYFQCDGQDRVHLPDITIEVSCGAICCTYSIDKACSSSIRRFCFHRLRRYRSTWAAIRLRQ